MKKLLTILSIIFCLNSFGQSITFILPASAHTSVGVYRLSDSMMLRTICADSILTSGSHTISWDGKDDYGVTILSPGTVFLKVLTNNVTYNWDGVVGNTSAVNTGTGVQKGYYTSITGMAISGSNAFICQGYSEAYASEARFNTADPQTRIDIFPGKVSTFNTDFVVTDGIKAYYACYDAYKTSNSSVHAIRVSDNTQVSFGGNGSVYKPVNLGSAKTYTSVIDTSLTAGSRPAGLAINSNYLFVAHGFLNRLDVLNKTTGARVQTLTYPNCRYLSIKNDTLWMVTGTNTVGKYTIQAGGTLSSIQLSIVAVGTPGATGVIGGEVAVIDEVNQVVRFFNTVTATEGTQLGVNGGYATSPDVTNYKYFFNDFRGNKFSFISVAPDGSFWFGDPGNFRELHFSAAKTYIETIMSMGSTYSTCADPNNITRVFGNYLEFAIDYSQPLTGSTGWALVKNWGYLAADQANTTSRRLLHVTTLSNGRTYGKDYATGGLVELTSTGLRATGVNIAGATIFVSINSDGSLIKYSGSSATGQSVTLLKYPLTGFDGSGNPIWSTTGTVLATTPPYPSDLSDPSSRPGIVNPWGYNLVTTSGKVIWYQPERNYSGDSSKNFTGYHLGAINLGGNSFIWKTYKANLRTYAGNYPPVNVFEIGNKVTDFAGSNVNVVDNNIITGYHGEGWKQGQTNYFHHFWEDGLAIGRFGTDWIASPTPAAAQKAGNALSPSLVKDNTTGNLYLYHGDESDHGGIHRWKISNLNSITEISSVSSNTSPVANAGSDQSITLPTTTATLTGSGTDADGTISSYAWTKVSGPAAGTITSPSSAITTITSLTLPGTYVYRLTVTDNAGATNTDLVSVVVSRHHGTRVTLTPGGDGGIYLVNTTTLLAGDTGCINAGYYPYISLDGLQGTVTDSIVIMNCGGQVIVNDGTGGYCYRVVNSQYFKFTGTGTTGVTYGFKSQNPGVKTGAGVTVKENCTHYVLENFDLKNTENGFYCKIDPADCTPESYSNGFKIVGVIIQNSIVDTSYGEGMYVINTSGGFNTVKNCSNQDSLVEQVMGDSIIIRNIRTRHTGWDAIQLAATTHAEIYNNDVYDYGWRNDDSQKAGILLGGKSDGSIHDNKIINGKGEGIEVFGYHKIKVYNNLVVDAGIGSPLQDAIDIDDRPQPNNEYVGLNVEVTGNTIVRAGRKAITVPNSYGTMSGVQRFYDNLIVAPASTNPTQRWFDFGAGVIFDTAFNQRINTVASANFVDTLNNDYRLLYNSSAVGTGIDLSSYGVTKDLLGVSRISPYDVGAYKFTGTIPLIPVVRKFIIYNGNLIIIKL